MLDFRVLGPLEVEGEDGLLRLGGPKQRATLAILLLHANRVVSIDRIADDLYSGAPPVTAVTQVQRQVSELRKLLGDDAIETRPPGYLVRVSSDQLDLGRFERLTADAESARARGDAAQAAELLAEALGLWRDEPLADLPDEAFADAARVRLDEMRLAADEERLDAELELGQGRALVAQLEELVVANPFRERLACQLMLALYRAGRQSDALATYRRTRARLVDELGIEPGPELRSLEASILAQDASLATSRASAAPPGGSLLVAATTPAALRELVALAGPLAARPTRELFAVLAVDGAGELATATAALDAQRANLPQLRVASFTSPEPAAEMIRLGAAYDVELTILDASGAFEEGRVRADIASAVERSPCDVALLIGAVAPLADGAGVFVPFGGGEHDWAALELGASIAQTAEVRLQLVGTTAITGRRDASKLLADASLAIQRTAGVAAVPVLVEPQEDALLAAVAPASIVVTGFASRWRHDGIGAPRRALVERAAPPTLLVHRGLKPGSLAPRESRTRFTWSVEPS
jgi:DNA-binding SARP family transcriptional activator